MSNEKREGPGLLTWLMGRVSHPPPGDGCTSCGAPGGDAGVARELVKAGHAAVAPFAGLCDACRKAKRNELLRGA